MSETAMLNLPQDDLEHIFAHTRPLWEALRGQRVFITGGTGFFGRWLLESLMRADDRLGLGVEVILLVRDPQAFQRNAPHLASHPAVRLHVGDVRDFTFPEASCSAIIHAATRASARLNREDPLTMFETIVQGTRRTLEYARRCSAPRVLLTSSGAVYGRQPPGLAHLPEDFPGGPNPVDRSSAYAEGKRAAEQMCSLYAHHHGIQVKIARGFAFVGPGLPLDEHYAIGNFIRDGLDGGPIRVTGDGTPYRSYLYAADLAIWLWKILIDGQVSVPYNVGSDQPITIQELAHRLAKAFSPEVQVSVAGTPDPEAEAEPERYVPSIARARDELGLQVWVDLDEAIQRTIAWHMRIGGMNN
ncbi:MAG: NAD-dependent epimerase/dehydratase family protein [Anaerolineales bacterium]|nr:NAD-dependent epimerase/dehydratase family protein [Anaerolineales bacterium]